MDSLLKKYTKLILTDTFAVKNANVVIIDFYNIYCFLVSFKKYNTFNKETWELTVKCIINTFPRNTDIFLISKPIFEINNENIKDITTKNKNVKYVIVEDSCVVKGTNKERDDYVCVFLHNLYKNAVIITNDNYTNYNCIISNIKEFRLVCYTNGNILNQKFDKKFIEKSNLTLTGYKKNLVKSQFYIKPKNFYSNRISVK
jgi:hypothetical protein